MRSLMKVFGHLSSLRINVTKSGLAGLNVVESII